MNDPRIVDLLVTARKLASTKTTQSMREQQLVQQLTQDGDGLRRALQLLIFYLRHR